MLILDTDHVVEYQRGTSVEARRLQARLKQATQRYATTIVTVEEIMRGWMAAIHRNTDPYRQVNSYAMLHRLFRFFATWNVVEWDDRAAEKFVSMRAAKLRIGTMDLKIASITLVHDATLLTRNTGDYERVPDLRIADWLS